MFQNSAARLLLPAVRNALVKRCETTIAGPPINKISTVEKAVVGGGMCLSFLMYPAWVLYHIREYRSGGN